MTIGVPVEDMPGVPADALVATANPCNLPGPAAAA
jgi:hypothetical protein